MGNFHIATLILLTALTVPIARGQQNPAPTYQLSIGALSGVEPPRLFYIPPPPGPGRQSPPPVELTVGRGNLPPPGELPFPSGKVLWSLGSHATEPVAENLQKFADMSAVKPGERWILLFYPLSSGAMAYRSFKADDEIHPAECVRVLNFGDSRVAVTVENSSQIVAVGGDVLFRPVLNPQRRFSFAAVSEKGDYLSPPQLLRLRTPQDRLLVICASQPTIQDLPSTDGKPSTVYTLGLVRLYDRAAKSAPLAEIAKQGDAGAVSSAPTSANLPTPIQALAWVAQSWLQRVGPSEIVDAQGSKIGEFSKAGPVTLSYNALPGEHVLSARKGGAIFTSITIAPDIRQPLVAAVGPVDESGKPTMLAFDNSAQSHPEGALRVFNLTPYQIAYSSGSGQKVNYVNPQESQVFSELADVKSLKFGIQTPSGWVLLGELESKTPKPSRKRAVFVFPEGGNGKFAMQEVEL